MLVLTMCAHVSHGEVTVLHDVGWLHTWSSWCFDRSPSLGQILFMGFGGLFLDGQWDLLTRYLEKLRLGI